MRIAEIQPHVDGVATSDQEAKSASTASGVGGLPPALPPASCIKLVIWKGSQFSIKALCAMACKGMFPDKHYQCVAGPASNDEKAKLKLLPKPHTIPVLLWNDEVVSGSDHICKFLDERVPAGMGSFLYPQDPAAAETVRLLENRAEGLYFPSGFLSIADRDGFQRFAGKMVMQHVRENYTGAWIFMDLAPNTAFRLVHSVVEKDFRAVMKRRGSPLTKERDFDKVLRDTKSELKALDALIAASPTDFFAGAEGPTAADCTLYGMLERFVGDMLQPDKHAASQPAILDDCPALRSTYARMRTFAATINLDALESYEELASPIKPVTYP